MAAEGEPGRTSQRIACDVTVGMRRSKGVACEITPRALFVALDSAVLPRSGEVLEIALELRAGEAPIEIGGEVQRRSLGSDATESALGRGVWIRILEAPVEFHRWLTPDASSADEDLPAAVALRGESPHEAVDDLPASRSRAATAPEPVAPQAAREERTPDVPRERTPAQRSSAATPAPDVLVVYDGRELDDIYALLDELGERPVRARLSGPTRFAGWSRPPRLFVIPAAEALRTELPEAASLVRGVRIAVADSSSDVLASRIARLGYDYLLRRPVHREVVRLLLQRALFRGSEVRSDMRRPAGQRVDLRVGWRRIPATLVEFSAGGARILVACEVDVLTEGRLCFSRKLLDGPPRQVACRVVRKRRDAGDDSVFSLALRFDEAIEPRALTSLASALGACGIGPAQRPPTPWHERWLSRFRRWKRPQTPQTPSPTAQIDEGELSVTADRRQLKRGVFDREIVALDASASAAARVLAGRDLSLAGMRIDPQPELRVGEPLRIALYDPLGSPIELDARVARDDGERGLALAFEGLTPLAAGRLHVLIAELPDVDSDGLDAHRALPGVERIDARGGERVVLARWIDPARAAAGGKRSD